MGSIDGPAQNRSNQYAVVGGQPYFSRTLQKEVRAWVKRRERQRAKEADTKSSSSSSGTGAGTMNTTA